MLAKILILLLFPNTQPKNFSGIKYFSSLLFLMMLVLRLVRFNSIFQTF